MKKLGLMTLAIALLSFTTDAQKLPGLDPSPADIAIFRPDGRGTTPIAKVTLFSSTSSRGHSSSIAY